MTFVIIYNRVKVKIEKCEALSKNTLRSVIGGSLLTNYAPLKHNIFSYLFIKEYSRVYFIFSTSFFFIVLYIFACSFRNQTTACAINRTRMCTHVHPQCYTSESCVRRREPGVSQCSRVQGAIELVCVLGPLRAWPRLAAEDTSSARLATRPRWSCAR